MTDNNIEVLKLMVRGAYDLQKLRMQLGLRLCANFRSRLKAPEDAADVSDDELSAEALKVLDELKESYRRLTDGVAKNRTLPAEKGFTGDALISTYAELAIVDQYIRMEKSEAAQFRLMTAILEKIPIYVEYLSKQKGIGPAMASVIVTYLDPHRARHASSFWKYAGVDVGRDGRGRSRRAEHLVERVYTDRNGDEAVRNSITYQPFLKTKLMGVLAGSFLRSKSPWRDVYDGYKHRIESDPNREKITVNEWKKKHRAGEDVSKLWTPSRIHNAAMRYMIKQFLADLWQNWRKLEGLPVTEPYAVAILGNRPHGEDRAA